MTITTRLKVAKLLILIPTIWYGLIPPIVDLNHTHILNPDWVGHARFHTMWLLVTNSLIAIIALVFLLKKIPNEVMGARIAGVLSLAVYAGFFGATFTKNLYSGTLGDGAAIRNIMGFDANLFFFIPITILLSLGTYISFKLPNK